jgi:hypothetical protein
MRGGYGWMKGLLKADWRKYLGVFRGYMRVVEGIDVGF